MITKFKDFLLLEKNTNLMNDIKLDTSKTYWIDYWATGEPEPIKILSENGNEVLVSFDLEGGKFRGAPNITVKRNQIMYAGDSTFKDQIKSDFITRNAAMNAGDGNRLRNDLSYANNLDDRRPYSNDISVAMF